MDYKKHLVEMAQKAYADRMFAATSGNLSIFDRERGMMYITEYGDPQGDEETLRYMLSYSPYHNVRPGTLYPRLLIQTGENDNNVPPYHGKKFAARLQECHTCAEVRNTKSSPREFR